MEKDPIENKISVITGGAQGIGFAIAEEFLKEGAKNVIILDILPGKGRRAVDILNSKYGRDKAVFIEADVTKNLDATFQVIINKFQAVDILVNNAGIVDESDIKKMFDINTIAPLEWSTKFLEYMRKDKGGNGGTILNISSVNGFRVDPYRPIYRASKYAIMGYSRTIGHVSNFNVTGVKVVTLCPAFTNAGVVGGPGKSLLPDEYLEYRKPLQSQDVSVVSRAAVEIIRTAATGSAWSVVRGKQMREVLQARVSKL